MVTITITDSEKWGDRTGAITIEDMTKDGIPDDTIRPMRVTVDLPVGNGTRKLRKNMTHFILTEGKPDLGTIFDKLSIGLSCGEWEG